MTVLLSPHQHQPFHYVEELGDQFLGLFPHRYDYIWAERPAPGERANWQTETRHPLSDRLLQQGKHLYGVRFGAQTRYLVIDIDAKSVYHPHRDRLGIARLLDALEPLGLVDYLACTSSYSGGVHLYIPFDTIQKTWNIAFAVHTALVKGGFQVAPGQLEIFPNPKLYVSDGTPNLYAAHRLPLQEPGSYLLSKEWELTHTTQAEFVRRWTFVAARNQVDEAAVSQLVDQGRRKQTRISKQAEKFLNDLNAEIERGWTGSGQTNRLLGRITMRSYIFAHVLYASEPLQGRALVRDIVAVAKTLPGYFQWCRHQSEIELRAEEWARCIENSAYFPYGFSKSIDINCINNSVNSASSLTHNQQQQTSARERIRQAIASLLTTNTLPVAPTARFHALTAQGIGGATLYRHRDLWHPNYLTSNYDLISVESIPVETSKQVDKLEPGAENLLAPLPSNLPFKMISGLDCLNATNPLNHQSLLVAVASNHLEDNGLSDRQQAFINQGSNNFPQVGREFNFVERVSRYLQSGDPILQSEAHAFVQSDCKTSQPLVTLPEPSKVITSGQDYREVVEAIAKHLCRLGWSSQQVGDRIWLHFGKASLALLNDIELVQWLEWLEPQVN